MTYLIIYLVGSVIAWVLFKLYRTTEPNYIGKTWFSVGFNIFIALCSWIGVLCTILITAVHHVDDNSKPPDWL